MHVGSAESAGGRLGAVLAAPRSGIVALGPHGPWLTTTPAQARQVLTDVDHFDFPSDVSRSGDLSASRGETRSGHLTFAPLTPAQVARGVATFAELWPEAIAAHDRARPGEAYDAMVLLRRPVARSTCDALLPGASPAQREAVAEGVLAWIDALAPVISAARAPRRWSRTRRGERDARLRLEDTLAPIEDLPGTPQQAATMLAAGIQVPIAAGSWLLAWLGREPSPDVEALHAVWESLRVTPPTWITARLTTTEVDLAGQHLSAGAVVLVSPLLLGRLPELVPGEPDGLADFDPGRWGDETRRPGAWLPFGAGPHSCPGRTLGLAVLVELAEWALAHGVRLAADVEIDQTRGLAPLPCRFTTEAAGGGAR
ncbi:hypothetical protein ASC64_02190 [Nocardioides sp. Root122]|uniref:cytochrome P450 n=1 Tax=Nocardioides sp. Root122 TaxID=1736431 RepID=UPI000702C44E|nr:cytochrome P450 [Nocardioides sp. Root122]KQV77663.1 hypothetical protein ASC64_02190 [Nocardioides sp. Root122]MCK9822118.1 cytochrome P450 [Nocardioides cavernae]